MFTKLVVPAAAAETNGGFIFRIQIRILVFLMCVADACPTVAVEASRLPSATSADLCYYLLTTLLTSETLGRKFWDCPDFGSVQSGIFQRNCRNLPGIAGAAAGAAAASVASAACIYDGVLGDHSNFWTHSPP